MKHLNDQNGADFLLNSRVWKQNWNHSWSTPAVVFQYKHSIDEIYQCFPNMIETEISLLHNHSSQKCIFHSDHWNTFVALFCVNIYNIWVGALKLINLPVTLLALISECLLFLYIWTWVESNRIVELFVDAGTGWRAATEIYSGTESCWWVCNIPAYCHLDIQSHVS